MRGSLPVAASAATEIGGGAKLSLRTCANCRIERGVQGSGHDLVTCTYTGAVSGNHYTATGFFTP
jgi:hypothetical protein